MKSAIIVVVGIALLGIASLLTRQAAELSRERA